MAAARPTVLVTGATGLLGPYLLAAFADAGKTVGTARKGADEPCDLLDAGQVDELLRRTRPDIVVHSAAMTDVDHAERSRDEAFALNAVAVATLVRGSAAGVRHIYVSTDQVYGTSAGPHREGDEAPCNVYGASKLAGELAVLARPGSLVARANFFGPSLTAGRASFSDWLANSMRGGQAITLFADVLFSPLHMKTLCGLLVEASDRQLSGTFNFGSSAGDSKAAFGQMVAVRLGLPLDRVTIGSSVGVPGRAPRPLDLRMDVSRLERALGRKLPTLAQEVALL